MTTTELKAVFEMACRDCKGRDRCMVPTCQGLADALTTAVEEEVGDRLEAAEDIGPKLLSLLKQAAGWMGKHEPPGDIEVRSLVDEANAAIAKAEGRN